jgi:L-alanine-DL-glutamate epimerase-like enolase superfamily enzyme
MFKKLVVGLLLATGISSAAHALTIEDFKQLSEGGVRQATTMYLGGINDAVKIMATWSNEDCVKWKVLSPNQIIAAFEAHYADIENKQTLIAYWAFEYSLKNGGCDDE